MFSVWVISMVRKMQKWNERKMKFTKKNTEMVSYNEVSLSKEKKNSNITQNNSECFFNQDNYARKYGYSIL